MPRHWLLLTGLLSLLVAAPACAEDLLRYAGATTLQHSFMPEAARTFQGETGVRIQIEGGNTNPGIKALLAGEVDMAGAGRHLTADEKKQGLVEHFLGWDALAVVVQRSATVDSLSREQLRGIFSGALRNWKEVGGRDEPIVVVTSPKGSGMRTAVQDLILGGKAFTANEVVSGVVGQADQQVAMFPGAITAVSLSMVDHTRVKVLKVDGVEPTAETVSAGRYPLIKPLALVTRGAPKGQLQRFLEFAVGSRGQAILARHFVPAAGAGK
ncbi:MAG: phosphate ABC transporter substrate-binding protein [Deltaproteobacteria bacterium]|nr:MAG: phosphate ABC transporter substrate-binding protein [Deltaproteobacteria bacterium]